MHFGLRADCASPLLLARCPPISLSRLFCPPCRLFAFARPRSRPHMAALSSSASLTARLPCLKATAMSGV
eukprot:14876130-Heterocapsa_arctica.AAC.1